MSKIAYFDANNACFFVADKDILDPTTYAYKQTVADDYTLPAPNASVLWQDIRARRDELLSACDWTQMPDVQLTAAQKSAWATYRQALRDITLAPTPAAVVFPSKPA